MEFSSAEQFEVEVHKCFGRIFELLVKVDGIVKQKAEEDRLQGIYREWADLQDWIEEVILQCHLAWQYHRLSKGPAKLSTWDRMKNEGDGESPSK